MSGMSALKTCGYILEKVQLSTLLLKLNDWPTIVQITVEHEQLLCVVHLYFPKYKSIKIKNLLLLPFPILQKRLRPLRQSQPYIFQIAQFVHSFLAIDTCFFFINIDRFLQSFISSTSL
ncbi:MAG: hypothetical protein ACJATI_000171 [Halioglobus sp.]|jgi:hypothetical protein